MRSENESKACFLTYDTLNTSLEIMMSDNFTMRRVRRMPDLLRPWWSLRCRPESLHGTDPTSWGNVRANQTAMSSPLKYTFTA